MKDANEKTLGDGLAEAYVDSLQTLDALLDRAARQVARTRPYRPCFLTTEAYEAAQAQYSQRVQLLDTLRHQVTRASVEAL